VILGLHQAQITNPEVYERFETRDSLGNRIEFIDLRRD
jgi:hypothetical protein